jgi:hypothetical protein
VGYASPCLVSSDQSREPPLETFEPPGSALPNTSNHSKFRVHIVPIRNWNPFRRSLGTPYLRWFEVPGPPISSYAMVARGPAPTRACASSSFGCSAAQSGPYRALHFVSLVHTVPMNEPANWGHSDGIGCAHRGCHQFSSILQLPIGMRSNAKSGLRSDPVRKEEGHVQGLGLCYKEGGHRHPILH